MIVMEKKYFELRCAPGTHLSSIANLLAWYKERGELAKARFNGQDLYSDIDDSDSIYMKVLGMTKTEFELIEATPQLTKEWIEKGNCILDKRYREHWAKIVPIGLGKIYRVMELGATLNIIYKLNGGCDIQEAIDIINKQNHSSASFGIVCGLVSKLCARGDEFSNAACENKSVSLPNE